MREAEQLHDHVDVKRLPHLRLDNAKVARDVAEDTRLRPSRQAIWERASPVVRS